MRCFLHFSEFYIRRRRIWAGVLYVVMPVSLPQSVTFLHADCDNLIGKGAPNLNASLSDCNMPCSGNAAETCGAGNRLNVFWSGATPPVPPHTVSSVGLWVSLGCYR
jgi:hypothetical protein